MILHVLINLPMTACIKQIFLFSFNMAEHLKLLLACSRTLKRVQEMSSLLSAKDLAHSGVQLASEEARSHLIEDI